MSSEQQPKILSHAVVKITTYRVRMLSARTSSVHFCSRLKEATLAGLLLACSSGSTRNAEIDGPRQFRLSTFRRKAWNILNNLTGRSRRSPRHCAVSANAIVSQLIINGRCEGIDRESSLLISQGVSYLWRATSTSLVNISESFTSKEFAAALKHLKPGKAPGPDSICPELITHAGAALKSWLCGFLSSCLHHVKIPQVLRRALVVETYCYRVQSQRILG